MKLRNMTSLFIEGDRGLLCLYRIGSWVADHMYIGSAGGHFEARELNTPKACILRELREELGLEEQDLRGLAMRYVTLRLKNGEIRQNYYFFAGLKEERELHSTEGLLRWIPFDEVPSLEMPVSAKQMILHYLHTGRFTDKCYAMVTQASGSDFVELTEF